MVGIKRVSDSWRGAYNTGGKSEGSGQDDGG